MVYLSVNKSLDEINKIVQKCPRRLRKEFFRVLFRDCLKRELQINTNECVPPVGANEPRKERLNIASKKRFTHWHGIIQLFSWVAWVTITIFIFSTGNALLEGYDKTFISVSLLTLTIAVTYSNAYIARPEQFAHMIAQQGERMRSCWLHANFSWQIANIWIIVSSIYSTGVVVYLSQSSTDLGTVKNRIIIYSVLSLLFSFVSTSIQPSKRARGFMQAYQEINRALNRYRYDPDNNIHTISEALEKGEAMIALTNND